MQSHMFCNWLTLESPYSFVSPDHSGFTLYVFLSAKTIISVRGVDRNKYLMKKVLKKNK